MDFASARQRMVDIQLRRRGIANADVLDAMAAVPREAFVASHLEREAYDDHPLSIGAGQTISQPYVVALMIEAAGIDRDAVVLEVGSGCGYTAAVVGRIARSVYGVERLPALVERAHATLQDLTEQNVEFRCGDGSAGWPEKAPFDAILVSAGAAAVPVELKRQLKLGGRMIIPVVQDDSSQVLTRITRHADAEFTEEALAAVAFVPLVRGEDRSS